MPSQKSHQWSSILIVTIMILMELEKFHLFQNNRQLFINIHN
ncbi:Uncharacterized protein APZ42_009804 [Daphnia magna]|uniref:Uncharacterized protein n=1 Tax=Daphnia magna TaxID=35525 RepID=A0A162BQ83_9CRUS|nr:Uncharacterized protein APZ42_009804 [Daphnia magna]